MGPRAAPRARACVTRASAAASGAGLGRPAAAAPAAAGVKGAHRGAEHVLGAGGRVLVQPRHLPEVLLAALHRQNLAPRQRVAKAVERRGAAGDGGAARASEAGGRRGRGARA
jgi:hypothetical protein